ncbi:MAG: hypothetical protein IPL33_19775 [Sphingobacteriales bacterium]|nr:hypothetical protein [Sphingobacteriales bacterium]
MQGIFGNKYDKDVAAIKPIVQKTNEVFEGLRHLDNDELRYHTIDFRQRIAEYLSAIDEEIAGYRQTVADNPDMNPTRKRVLQSNRAATNGSQPTPRRDTQRNIARSLCRSQGNCPPICGKYRNSSHCHRPRPRISPTLPAYRHRRKPSAV